MEGFRPPRSLQNRREIGAAARAKRDVTQPPPARAVEAPELVHRLVESEEMRLRPGAADDALGLGEEQRQGQRVDGAGGVEPDRDPRPVGLPRAAGLKTRARGGHGPAPRPSWRPTRRPDDGATGAAGRSARGRGCRAGRPPTRFPQGAMSARIAPSRPIPVPALRPASSARSSWLRQSAVCCRSPSSSGSPRLRSCAKPRVTPQSRAFSAIRASEWSSMASRSASQSASASTGDFAGRPIFLQQVGQRGRRTRQSVPRQKQRLVDDPVGGKPVERGIEARAQSLGQPRLPVRRDAARREGRDGRQGRPVRQGPATRTPARRRSCRPWSAWPPPRPCAHTRATGRQARGRSRPDGRERGRRGWSGMSQARRFTLAGIVGIGVGAREKRPASPFPAPARSEARSRSSPVPTAAAPGARGRTARACRRGSRSPQEASPRPPRRSARRSAR